MGTLYVVGTPIGNLEGVTLRALRILREVPLIAAEDTRRARILASRYEIKTPITSYFEGNKAEKSEVVLRHLETGDVALISEAGMPGLSDPGYELIRAAIDRGCAVVPIPGPTAPATALVVSGLPTDRYTFLGFLPRRRSERRRLLAEVSRARYTLIAFDAPHRLRKSLGDMEELLGDRPIACCREMTKMYEEIWRGTISGARAHFEEVEPRGEFTLVIGGSVEASERWSREKVQVAMDEALKQGMSRPNAARRVAALSGWSRSEIYDLSLGKG